ESSCSGSGGGMVAKALGSSTSRDRRGPYEPDVAERGHRLAVHDERATAGGGLGVDDAGGLRAAPGNYGGSQVNHRRWTPPCSAATARLLRGGGPPPWHNGPCPDGPG